jgi:Apea-like HEPN
MINVGKYTFESYAHILNADKSILKLNSTIENFGYKFLWVDASDFESNFSEIVNVFKSQDRPLTIMIGREYRGISHELHNALIHTPPFGQMFMHMEYPGILLLRKLTNFEVIGDHTDFTVEKNEFSAFYSFANDLILQLRLFKIGEIRYSQFFHITSQTRQIGLRKHEIAIGSAGDYTLTDAETEILSKKLVEKYECNALTELAIKNFSVVYDLPDGRIRFITLMTCLESLFNLGRDQIAHTIARHLSIILSKDKSQFNINYSRIKKLYNMRNSIVHGGEYKGDIIQDYLELSNNVRAAINYCNVDGLTKEKLFAELNSTGF